MPTRVAISKLNANTRQILNVIRKYAPPEYQSTVPKVLKDADIPVIGEIFQGYPAMADYFIGALLNRIALVNVKSATFNNRFAFLKKGYLEYGEVIEDVFVKLAKVRGFNVEKAPEREFARTLPDTETQFHVINWRVQYPITIQDEDLRTAFLSAEGVTAFIAKIVNSIYEAEEYDEYLLFKYLLIKNIARNNIKHEYVDLTDFDEGAIAFRAMSSNFTFMKNKYNTAGVKTTTPKNRQVIFMDSDFAARFDVKVLAAAFNMDKADFLAQLVLVDSWDEFDNERFEEVRRESTQIELVTDEELEGLKHVKAVICDMDWFQVYDNLIKFTEKYVASGMYWNYFLNVYKTISYSIFSNAVAFFDEVTQLPATITATVTQRQQYENSTIIVLSDETGMTAAKAATKIAVGKCNYMQTRQATESGIAVHPYGAYILSKFVGNTDPRTVSLQLALRYEGKTYVSNAVTLGGLAAGATVVFTEGEPAIVSGNCVPNGVPNDKAK